MVLKILESAAAGSDVRPGDPARGVSGEKHALAASQNYVYAITLNDGSTIAFRYGLR